MKKILLSVVALAMTFCLVACNSMGDIELKPEENGIFIKGDGSIMYGSCEPFDKEYFDADVLKNEIDTEINAFNASEYASGEDAAKVDMFKANKKEVRLVLRFATTKDFNNYAINYNHFPEDSFYIGGIADNDKCEIAGRFVKPGTKEEVKSKEIRNMKDCILITSTPFKVQVEGEIKYISKNCSVDEKKIVSTSANEGELSYIVYSINK